MEEDVRDAAEEATLSRSFVRLRAEGNRPVA